MLLFISINERFQFYFAHFFIMRKVSRIALKVTVKKFVHFVYGNVKKISVVAYK